MSTEMLEYGLVIAVVLLVILLVFSIIKKAGWLIAGALLLLLLVPPVYTVAFGDGTEIVAGVASIMPTDLGNSMMEAYAEYKNKDAENDLFGANESDSVINGFVEYGTDHFKSAFDNETTP